MLSVEVQFQIETLYTDGLKHLELPDLSWRGNHLAFSVQYAHRKTLTVRRAVLASPRRSARRQALALGMSRRSLYRILHDELKFHLYKIMIVQQLAEWDFAQRRDFCENMLAILTEDANAVVVMSDEAHFHLNGFVNKQNCRFWAAENPRELHQRPLHSWKVTVWCGVSKVGIVGPYFFEEGRLQFQWLRRATPTC